LALLSPVAGQAEGGELAAQHRQVDARGLDRGRHAVRLAETSLGAEQMYNLERRGNMARTPGKGAEQASVGRASGSPPRSGPLTFRFPSTQQAFLAAVIVLLTGVVLFVISSHVRPSAAATIHLSGISRVDFKGQVAAEFSAYIQHLHLGSPTGQVDLALPVPGSQCQDVASALGGTCGTTGLTLPTSLDARWDSPEQVTLVSHQSGEVILTAMPPEQGGEIEMVFVGGSPARLCLTRSLDRAKLTLGPSATPVTLPTGGAQPLSSCDGLILHLGSSQLAGPSVFWVDQVADASARLTGLEIQVSASDERFTVTPGDSDHPVTGPLTLRSEKPFSLTTAGVAPNITSVSDVQTAGATSLFVFGAERIPTLWRREQPFFTALGVAGPLTPLVLWLIGNWSARRKGGPAQ